MAKRSRRTIRTLSLFSGAGGLDIGFSRAGFDIRTCIEIEPAYCETLLANHGTDNPFGSETSIHCQDIREFDARTLLKAHIECVIGGPPCQTFSAAGRRSGGVLGTSDLRGRLFESYCSVLDILKPKAFIFENVYGLPGANGGGPWREICAAFSSRGYALSAEVLDAADYGVPQHRERLFIVGLHHASKPFRFPTPTHGPDSRSSVPFVSAMDAISDLQDVQEPFHELGGLYGHLLSQVPEGLNYSFFTQEMGYPQPHFAWRSKFHDFLYKVNRSTPVRTVKAQPGKFTGPFHWKNRHFTAAELKRLQTFPDSYEIVGSPAKVMEQIGNSVPPLLAEVLATSLRDQFLDPIPNSTYAERPAGFRSTFRQRQRERTTHFKAVAQQEVKKRFPKLRTITEAKQSSRSFFVSFESRFEKTVLERPELGLLGQSQFNVTLAPSARRISIRIDRLYKTAGKQITAKIAVSGLQKYLSSIDALDCVASVDSLDDIFNVWNIIQDILVEKSRFFSLIDIYGHYANRGDSVKVLTKLTGHRHTAVSRAISFFGDSANCGRFIAIQELADALSLQQAQLPSLLLSLRALRWDVRDASTHSTITRHGMICTYPFPLLSARAQFERKIQEGALSS